MGRLGETSKKIGVVKVGVGRDGEGRYSAQETCALITDALHLTFRRKIWVSIYFEVIT